MTMTTGAAGAERPGTAGAAARHAAGRGSDMDDKRKALLRLLRGAPAKPETVEGIAVIGLAGRYPRAGTPDELWARTRDGESCIQEFPSVRGPGAQPSGGGLPDGRRWW